MNQRKNGPRVLLVLAIAASGDVQGALTQVEKGNARHYLIEECYRDEDLGPILQSDAFRDFRKRHSEPPKNPTGLPDETP